MFKIATIIALVALASCAEKSPASIAIPHGAYFCPVDSQAYCRVQP